METGFKKWIIVVTVVFCCLLELIDTSIVNVALTQMMGNLSATQQEVTWVIASYGIANVIVIPMTGFLAEQFGRKNYYLVSVVIFTLASIACGQSTNIWELVAFRFIQGVGGGALMATSQAILIDTFPPKQLALVIPRPLTPEQRRELVQNLAPVQNRAIRDALAGLGEAILTGQRKG